MGRPFSQDDVGLYGGDLRPGYAYAPFAASIFLDILNVFLLFLQLFGRND